MLQSQGLAEGGDKSLSTGEPPHAHSLQGNATSRLQKQGSDIWIFFTYFSRTEQSSQFLLHRHAESISLPGRRHIHLSCLCSRQAWVSQPLHPGDQPRPNSAKVPVQLKWTINLES